MMGMGKKNGGWKEETGKGAKGEGRTKGERGGEIEGGERER
jgi:hypothetical protein